MLRFLRGKQHNVIEASNLYAACLKWRKDNNVDDIRNNILYGGINSPLKFPHGKILLNLAPQIVISSQALDKKGRPLGKNKFLQLFMHIIFV